MSLALRLLGTNLFHQTPIQPGRRCCCCFCVCVRAPLLLWLFYLAYLFYLRTREVLLGPRRRAPPGLGAVGRLTNLAELVFGIISVGKRRNAITIAIAIDLGLKTYDVDPPGPPVCTWTPSCHSGAMY